EGVRNLLGGGENANQVVDFVSQIGEFFKGVTGSQSGQPSAASTGTANVTPWLLGGGLAVVVLLLAVRKRGGLMQWRLSCGKCSRLALPKLRLWQSRRLGGLLWVQCLP